MDFIDCAYHLLESIDRKISLTNSKCFKLKFWSMNIVNIVLVLLTANHFIYLYFDCFIENVVSSDGGAGEASLYGLAYGFLIFPFQFLLELALFFAFLYQVLIVRQWRASIWCWSTFLLTLFLILDIGY